MEIIDRKICIKCNKEKLLTEFHKKSSGKFGRRAKCKECRTIDAKKFWIENREIILAESKKAWIENYDETLAQSREHYKKNKEKIDAYRRQYALDNPEKEKEWKNKNYQKRKILNETPEILAKREERLKKRNDPEYQKKRKKEYKIKNRLKYNLYAHNRRIKKLEIINKLGSYTQEELIDLFEKYDYKCLGCGVKENKENNKTKLTVDHIIPISKGGNNLIENIQPLCKSCNSRKKDKTIDFRNLGA